MVLFPPRMKRSHINFWAIVLILLSGFFIFGVHELRSRYFVQVPDTMESAHADPMDMCGAVGVCMGYGGSFVSCRTFVINTCAQDPLPFIPGYQHFRPACNELALGGDIYDCCQNPNINCEGVNSSSSSLPVLVGPSSPPSNPSSGPDCTPQCTLSCIGAFNCVPIQGSQTNMCMCENYKQCTVPNGCPMPGMPYQPDQVPCTCPTGPSSSSDASSSSSQSTNSQNSLSSDPPRISSNSSSSSNSTNSTNSASSISSSSTSGGGIPPSSSPVSSTASSCAPTSSQQTCVNDCLNNQDCIDCYAFPACASGQPPFTGMKAFCDPLLAACKAQCNVTCPSSSSSSSQSSVSCPSGYTCISNAVCITKGGTNTGDGNVCGANTTCCRLPSSSSQASGATSSAVSCVTSAQSSQSAAPIRMRITYSRVESTSLQHPARGISYINGPQYSGDPEPLLGIPSGQWFDVSTMTTSNEQLTVPIDGPQVYKTGGYPSYLSLKFNPPGGWNSNQGGYAVYYGTIEVTGTVLQQPFGLTSNFCRPQGDYQWYCPEKESDNLYLSPDNDEVFLQNGVVYFYIHTKNVTNSDGRTDVFDVRLPGTPGAPPVCSSSS